MSKKITYLIIVLACVVSTSDAAPSQLISRSSDDCAQLARIDFAGIEDAPTQIIASKVGEPDRSSADSYCQVDGYVAPAVGFRLRMPLKHWNRKFLQMGCGGHCGSTEHIARCRYALTH